MLLQSTSKDQQAYDYRLLCEYLAYDDNCYRLTARSQCETRQPFVLSTLLTFP